MAAAAGRDVKRIPKVSSQKPELSAFGLNDDRPIIGQSVNRNGLSYMVYKNRLPCRFIKKKGPRAILLRRKFL